MFLFFVSSPVELYEKKIIQPSVYNLLQKTDALKTFTNVSKVAPTLVCMDAGGRFCAPNDVSKTSHPEMLIEAFL